MQLGKQIPHLSLRVFGCWEHVLVGVKPPCAYQRYMLQHTSTTVGLSRDEVHLSDPERQAPTQAVRSSDSEYNQRDDLGIRVGWCRAQAQTRRVDHGGNFSPDGEWKIRAVPTEGHSTKNRSHPRIYLMKLAIGIVFAAVAVAAVAAGDPATLSTKEEATKTTKATKSEKTGTASGSGIGSLFEDGSQGTIGSDSAADATADPKMLTRIGITVPMGKDGSGGLNLGPGPAVYPSGSGSWDWSWDSVEGSGSSTETSTAGSSEEACPDACTMEYSPVTDENGKTYSNECAMRLAKCKGETGEKKKIVDFAVLDEPTVVTGTKEAETPATKTTKATKSEKTGTASGSGIGSLFEDGSSGVIGSDSESGSADPTLVKGDPTLVKGDPTLVKGDPTLVKGTKEAETPATKTTKATKSEKTGTASGSGIGSLFEDGSSGVIGSDSESGSADPTLVKGDPTLVKGDPTLVKGDPTLVKGTKEAETPATKTTKATKSEKTGTASGSGIGSLFEDGSSGVIGSDSESGSADPTLVKGDPTLVKGDPTLVKGDPTLVKGTKEAETPATKTTKATKSEKTGTASGSGIGSLFEDGSSGVIGNNSESGSADPTLVKGSKGTPIPIQIIDVITVAPVVEATKTTKATKSTKSEKTGTTSSSSIGSLFDDGSNGVIGSESGSADPTLVKAPPAEKTKTTKILP